MGTIKAGALALVLVLACKQGERAENDKVGSAGAGATTGSAAPADEAVSPTPTSGAAAEAGPRKLDAPPPAKLLDAPVERRLHSDRVEASSFLWTDWNRFQENYHPNYLLDGDPATAWVEGADGSGAGEWVRIHISPVEGASKIRIRIRNGYHKSKALHGRNARLKQLELVALPGGTKHTATLEDAMGWQELAFEQPAGKLDAIELRAVEVFEGSKYTDLCISDVELYVTALTPENPAFEKSKLDSLLAWKKRRLEAAKLLGGAKANELPILTGYRVVRGDKLEAAAVRDNKPHRGLRGTLAALANRAAADAVKRASAALESEFKGWVRVQVVARDAIELPEVDGLRAAGNEDLVWGGSDDAFLLPASEQGNLVRSSHLSTFDTKGENPMNDFGCKKDKSEFMRPPRTPEDGPVVRELLHVRCVTEETREGEATYMVWQLLEYDAQGRLVLTVGPHHQVQWFEWKQDGTRSVIAGGGRLANDGDKLLQLAVAAK